MLLPNRFDGESIPMHHKHFDLFYVYVHMYLYTKERVLITQSQPSISQLNLKRRYTIINESRLYKKRHDNVFSNYLNYTIDATHCIATRLHVFEYLIVRERDLFPLNNQ